MDRRQAMMVLVAAGTLTMSGRATAAPRDLTAEVRALLDRYAAAWNASDMDAMAALYTDDVHWVNIVGMHWQGKDAVDRAHRAFFDIMFKGVPLALEEVESIVAQPGGGAIVVARWSVGAFRTPAGQAVPPSRDRMSLVLVPANDRLAIRHGANIQIDEMAQKSNPIQKG